MHFTGGWAWRSPEALHTRHEAAIADWAWTVCDSESAEGFRFVWTRFTKLTRQHPMMCSQEALPQLKASALSLPPYNVKCRACACGEFASGAVISIPPFLVRVPCGLLVLRLSPHWKDHGRVQWISNLYQTPFLHTKSWMEHQQIKQIKLELLPSEWGLGMPGSPSCPRMLCWVHSLKTTAIAARPLNLKLEHRGSNPGSAM